MCYIQLSYLFNLEQLLILFPDTDIFEAYSVVCPSLAVFFLIKLYFMFECFISPKVLSSLIMKKGMSTIPKWKWESDTVARSTLPGTLTKRSGHECGSWLGRMQLDSSLSVKHPVKGDAGALCCFIISLCFVMCSKL